MELSTLTAIVEKLNRDLDDGNHGAVIPPNTSREELEDAFREIQIAVSTLSSALLFIYRHQPRKAPRKAAGFTLQLPEEEYTKLQDAKHEGETDSQAVIRLVEVGIESAKARAELARAEA